MVPPPLGSMFTKTVLKVKLAPSPSLPRNRIMSFDAPETLGSPWKEMGVPDVIHAEMSVTRPVRTRAVVPDPVTVTPSPDVANRKPPIRVLRVSLKLGPGESTSASTAPDRSRGVAWFSVTVNGPTVPVRVGASLTPVMSMAMLFRTTSSPPEVPGPEMVRVSAAVPDRLASGV